MKEEYVGGSIFGEIITDERVNSELSYCLFCVVTSINKVANAHETVKPLDYKIPLDNTTKHMKQCPACKRIYILKDPRE